MQEKLLTIFSNFKWYYFIPIVLFIFFLLFLANNNTNKENLELEPIIGDTETVSSKFKIDVKGEVINPGVYEVDETMIVLDAINLAGGITTNGNTSNLNLSEKLYESMVINVESKLEDNKTTNNKISINKGTKEELMTLSGIGESKALSIIAYRQEKRFTKIEDIMLVSGIGESTFAKIKNYITI